MMRIEPKRISQGAIRQNEVGQQPAETNPIASHRQGRLATILAGIAHIQHQVMQEEGERDHFLRALDDGRNLSYDTIPFQLLTTQSTPFEVTGYRRFSHTTNDVLSATSSYFRIIQVSEETDMAHLELLFHASNQTSHKRGHFESMENSQFFRTDVFVSVDLSQFLGIVTLPAVRSIDASIRPSD